MEKFEQTYSYKLIYVFSMPYETHKGMLKVGEATLKTDIMPNELVPNCHILNQAAKARIDSYTKTASMSYKLEYTELALKTEFGYSFTFKDKDVHKVLMNSGVHKVQPNGATGEEWFATDIETVKAAIKSVKNGKSTLSSSDFVRETRQETIDFREEQINAIEKTLKTFKKDDEMLWYAKMRFGKTLSALEVIRRSQYRRVIIATHRPVVDDGWSEDFKKIFFPGNSEHEYHYERKTKDSAYTFDEKTDAENDLKIRKLDKDGTYFVYFASVQDLRGSKIVGGKFNKNNAVFALDWDLIIIDEAHEGTQTELGDNVVKALKKDHTKVLALSGTPFNLLDKFGEDKGGIAITYWDNNAEFDIIGFFSPYKELKSIVNKVIQREDFLSFATLVYPRDLYKLTDELYNENEWAITRPSKGHKYDVGTNVFDTFPELFFDECPTDGADYIQIYGRKENTRCSKWIKRSYVKLPDNIDYYKVFIPKSNGSGAIGEVLSTPVVGRPVVGHTVTFLSIGKYETVYEAEATLKYIKSKFLRTLLGALKVTQDNPRETWSYVPMQDFTKHSDIDWTKSVHDIDLQLYKKYGLSDEEIAFIESKVKPMDGTSYYESMLKMSYQDIVSALLKKYGSAKHNYFKDTACKIKNSLVTRTNEGLFCHHIDEDKAIMLCNDKFAANNPFEYQKAARLVYCNLLEHLLLHVKIAENPSLDANENELPGIGGAINFICKDLNDIYSGKEFSDEWRKNVADKVKDNFDDYIIILRYLWYIVEKNPVYKAIITKEMLCVGWDGKVVKEVMNALNANE